MKLVDVKRPKESKKTKQAIEAIDAGDKYPWGLRLDFEDDVVDKVFAGVDLAVGDDVTVKATAKVIETSARDTHVGTNRRVEIQITHIAVEPKIDAEKAFDQGAK